MSRRNLRGLNILLALLWLIVGAITLFTSGVSLANGLILFFSGMAFGTFIVQVVAHYRQTGTEN